VTDPTDALAARLLDAQVAWVVGRLEHALPALVARDVADLLDTGSRVSVGTVADPDAITAVIAEVLTRVPPSTAASTFTAVLAEVLHDGPTGEHTLGQVVAREHVEALADTFLSGGDRLRGALDDLTRSPAVSALATRFMGRVVAEVVQANRAVAEKLPGVGSLVSLYAGAAGKVMGATQLDALVGVAAGQGAGFAVRRLNAIVVETLRDPGTRAAVLEVYDLYADQPLSGAGSVPLERVQQLAGMAQDVVIGAAASEPVLAMVRAVVEGFVATYADHPVSELLTDLGLDAEVLTEHLLPPLTALVAAARESGDLEPLVRARLAPFWESDEVAAILA
jgi:hypothetical protein